MIIRVMAMRGLSRGGIRRRARRKCWVEWEMEVDRRVERIVLAEIETRKREAEGSRPGGAEKSSSEVRQD